MAKQFILLSLILAYVQAARISAESSISGGTEGRIVGGSDAPDGAYPHHISIKFYGTHNCGGSIINPEWILTAAHCVYGFNLNNLEVYVGSNRWDEGGTTHKVLETITHELYDSVALVNDVALVKVNPITYTNKVQPILLDVEEVGGDETCVLSGWGALTWPGTVHHTLQHIELKTTTFEYCKEAHKENPFEVYESEICTFTKVGEGTCPGDSGGPLIRTVDGIVKQIGIVSWIYPYCARGNPDVYTRISSFTSWIKENCNCI